MSASESVVFRADRFNIHRVHQVGPDGKERQRDIIRHPGAVVLLPITTDGRIVMIHNYRISLQRTLLEVPAGTMEAGESPATTAARELIEETGYRAGNLELLRVFYASPGICDEAMYLYLATELVLGEPDREDYEQIENVLASWDEVRQWLEDGTIQDAKTLVALMDYQRRKGF